MRLVAEFATAEDYLAVHEQEIAQGGLLVRGAELPPATPLGDCTLAIRIRGAEAAWPGKPDEIPSASSVHRSVAGCEYAVPER